MPSVWFMNGLHCRKVTKACPYDVVGVSFPGVPGIVLGHNARIAWGATNVDPDVQDLFVEKVDPANPDNYLFRGESVPFTVREETIKVAGGEDVVIEVRETRHGPILNDVDPRLEDGPAAGPRLDGDRRGRRHARVDLRDQHGRNLRGVPGRVRDATARRPRTSSTPTSTATSAMSSRAMSRSEPIPTDRGDRDPVRKRRQARMDRTESRSRTCPGSSTRRAG